jgi:hypothetical protein
VIYPFRLKWRPSLATVPVGEALWRLLHGPAGRVYGYGLDPKWGVPPRKVFEALSRLTAGELGWFAMVSAKDNAVDPDMAEERLLRRLGLLA